MYLYLSHVNFFHLLCFFFLFPLKLLNSLLLWITYAFYQVIATRLFYRFNSDEQPRVVWPCTLKLISISHIITQLLRFWRRLSRKFNSTVLNYLWVFFCINIIAYFSQWEKWLWMLEEIISIRCCNTVCFWKISWI